MANETVETTTAAKVTSATGAAKATNAAEAARAANAAKAAPDSTRRSERSRRAIFDAALSLVGEVGYEKLTIEGIASRAGVGKQTIYRWWGSKAEVLLDAFLAVAEGDAARGLPDTGDIEADLKAVLRATADEFNDPAFQALYRALAVAGANDEKLARQFAERLTDLGTQAYVDRLHVAREVGQIGDHVDLRIAADMLTAPFAQRWLMYTGELSHEFTDSLVELVLGGLTPRA